MTKCKCGCGEEVKDGKTWVNGGHAAKWAKLNKVVPTQESINKNDTTNKFPKKLLSTKEIKEMKANQTEKLTEEQKFLKFFSNLPKWTEKKPGSLAKWFAKIRTKSDFQIKLCVFVDDVDGQHKQTYIPFNTELGLLVTDTSYYDVPMNGSEPIFLDKTRFTPLVNRKNYKDEYDLSEDFAESLLNTGIIFSQLKQFKDLIAKIDQMSLIMWACIILVIIAIAGSAYTMYADGKHYQVLAQALDNISRNP